MFTKANGILILIVAVLCFVVGRRSVKPVVVTQVETREVEAVEHDKRQTVTVRRGDTTTTTTTDDITTAVKIDDTQTKSAVLPRRSSMNVSALVGTDSIRYPTPVYGLSISKELIGPVTLGLWGLTNGTVGVSVGVNF